MAIADCTTSIRLCPLVLNNDFHHPVHLAQELASLDHLSGGRLEVGIGAGHSFPEYAAIGQSFDPPAVRKARLADAVQELLANLLPESGLLTVEDSHFMDESSADLFRAMAASVGATSWLICMTRRDLESGFVAPDDATRIDLGPLDEQETTRLAEAATSETPLSASELGVLVRRSGGNPLFLRELLAAALGGAEVEGLPDSVEGVVAARIDRLSSDDRHLLRRLSVLGQSAPIDLVGAVVDELPAPRHPVWRRLDDFVVWDRDTLRFRNGVLRDAAYDGLTYRLRRQLHNRAGDSIRSRSSSSA